MQHVADQSAQADGQAHARILAVALGGEVVVAATGADGTKRGGAVEEGLVDGAGVIVESTGDLQVRDHGAGADGGGLVDDHGQGIESLTGQLIGLGILGDAVRLAQRVELGSQLGTIGGGKLGQFEAGARLGLGRTAGFGKQSGHLVGADLVELVDLAQHTFDVRQTESTVEAFGQLAVVGMHGGLGQAVCAQLFQGGNHDQRQLHLIVVRQVARTNHVDVGLHELAEAALLRTLTAPDLLNLPTLEREGQRTRVLDHIPAQRNGQIEMQTQTVLNRSVGFVTDLLQTGKQVDLLAGLAFFQQRSAGFHRSRLNADEAVELKNLTKRIDAPLATKSI